MVQGWCTRGVGSGPGTTLYYPTLLYYPALHQPCSCQTSTLRTYVPGVYTVAGGLGPDLAVYPQQSLLPRTELYTLS